jgi:Mce-associated membrane protein
MSVTPPGSPTWYDVLGVAPDASAEEIKAAWRRATDRFEPGEASGQFRMFNQAADVLLDPERRASYDATLIGPAPADHPAEQPPAPSPVPQDVEPLDPPAPTPLALQDTDAQDREEQPAAATKEDGALVRALGRTRPLVLTTLAVLTVAVLVLAVVLGTKAHQQAQVATARDEAPAAADSAVKALFSYDYRKLDADRKRAEDYLSGSFEKTYLRNFDALQKQKDGTAGLAVQSKAVVTADVANTGVVDVNADGTVVRVLVFVNLTSRKGTGAPTIFQNRVAMTMDKDGDRWLVDNVDSY